eukprot:TRINITY_DN108657_c0_g1_i1.p1 TRINITY_DN108657_c0_g1~~TRINITY_DN108657_c0_g1_i1.p1  ORF type:complete len:450 (+),score=52.49 TRINITY_DN108657_c0_g1_i1:60-1409(+)
MISSHFYGPSGAWQQQDQPCFASLVAGAQIGYPSGSNVVRMTSEPASLTSPLPCRQAVSSTPSVPVQSGGTPIVSSFAPIATLQAPPPGISVFAPSELLSPRQAQYQQIASPRAPRVTAAFGSSPDCRPPRATAVFGTRTVAEPSTRIQGRPSETPELTQARQEMSTLMREALMMLCEQLKLTTRNNRLLAQRNASLAAQLAAVKPELAEAENVTLLSVSVGAASGTASPALPPSLPTGVAQDQAAASGGAAMPSSRRVTIASDAGDSQAPRASLRLSRKLLRRLTIKKSIVRKQSMTDRPDNTTAKEDSASESSESSSEDSGSEIFDSNKPEDVQEMQRILQELARRFCDEEANSTCDDSMLSLPSESIVVQATDNCIDSVTEHDTKKESLKSTYTSRSSKGRPSSIRSEMKKVRLAPGLASEGELPPRELRPTLSRRTTKHSILAGS